MSHCSGQLRLLVHDFSGHPFQAQLSRELAARGHEVLHVYCKSYVTGRGRLQKLPSDPECFHIRAVDLGQSFSKYAPVTRVRQEAVYAQRFGDIATQFRPDVVIESNDPLLAKWQIARRLRQSDIPWIFWLQDLYSVAIAAELAGRFGAAGRLAGRAPLAAEGTLLRRAHSVVAITPDFDEHLERWGVHPERRRVIPNWAPIDEIRPQPPNRAWAEQHGITARHVVLYAGTLGLKHDPSLLVHLTQELRERDASVVVVSEGAGADYLVENGSHLPNLHVLPFQPYGDLPDVLGSADVVLTILNGEAGVFSVPSKLLTYLCAGRAVVAAVPGVNLAARVLEESGGGLVVRPDDARELADGVSELLDDPCRRQRMAQRGRSFAEQRFDIRDIAGQFLQVIGSAAGM